MRSHRVTGNYRLPTAVRQRREMDLQQLCTDLYLAGLRAERWEECPQFSVAWQLRCCESCNGLSAQPAVSP